MKKATRLLALLMALTLSMALLPMSAAAEDVSLEGKTVVLYTGNIRGDISLYPLIAAMKADYAAKAAAVILVDAGNFLQGTVYTSFDRGATVVSLMDTVGYDAVAVGQYEFAFGDGTLGAAPHGTLVKHAPLAERLKEADFTAVAANIEGSNDSFAFEKDTVVTTDFGLKVGFYGLTDPVAVTQVLSSNLDGLTIGTKGAMTSDCDVAVCLANLPAKPETQAGAAIHVPAGGAPVAGALVINGDGTIEADITIDLSAYTPDAAVAEKVTAVKAEVDALYPVVATSQVTLNGNQVDVRSQETNTGNLWTDALRWFATEGDIGAHYDEDDIAAGNTGITVDSDHVVALWNGGNLRDYLNTGDIIATDIERVLPYPNTVAVVYLTGAQLLEQLEAATYGQPYSADTLSACAAFPQVSGIEYTLDLSKDYDAGEAYGNNWFKAGSVNRVTITAINGKAFDADATYAVITSNAIYNGMDAFYVCADKGEQSAITSAKVTTVVWRYINEKLNGVIGADYAAPQGRITVKAAPEKAPTFTDVAPGTAYYTAVEYCYAKGLMNGTGAGFSPELAVSRAMMVTVLWRLAGMPEAGQSAFADVAAGSYYADAVAWANAHDMVVGYSDDIFGPHDDITGEQFAAILTRYAEHKAYTLEGLDLNALAGEGDTVSRGQMAVALMAFCQGID